MLNISLLIDWMHKGHASQRFPPLPLCSLLTYKGVPVADTFAAGMTSEVNSFGPLSVINRVWKGGSDRESGGGGGGKRPKSQANGTEPEAGLGMTAD